MLLRWRLVLPAVGAAHDVVVAAGPGTTVSELRTALSAHLAAGQQRLHVGLTPVHEHAALGQPPLLDGATIILDEPRPAPTGRTLLQLHVRSGPDTGYVFDLPRGEHSVGRCVEASVRLDDADVSRVHAILDVRTRDVTIRDAGSTNGTYVDAKPVGPQPVPLVPGQPVRLGRTTLVLCIPGGLPAAVRPDGAGHLLVNRSPRLAGQREDQLVEFPQQPVERVPARLSWLAALLPLAISGAIALILRSPTMLLFGLMSPILLVGQWVGDRRGARRSRREAHKRYAVEQANANEHLSQALAAEASARHDNDPGPAAILAIARRPLARLWERDARADGIQGRIGVGEVEARTTCSTGRATRIGPVPVCADLSAPGGVGIAGPRFATLAAARALLGRIATLYSPRDLHIVVVARPEHRGDWAWTRRLPHIDPFADESADLVVDGLARTMTDRTPATGHDRWLGPRVLAVVDGAAALRTQAGLTAVLADGHRCGVHTLTLDRELSRLPAEAASVLDLTRNPATLTTRRHAGQVEVSVDSVALGWAERLADALVPLRDSAPAAASGLLPRTVSLLDLLDLQDASGSELAQRWRRSPRSTAFPVGANASGPVMLDLQRDGPHALIGGTTGSGKSELLVALVASLAAVNRPDELTFVLVDYKGGAAFAGCVDLPHVVGLVTDLDAALTERAMTSLDAELKRRERILAEHGCRDLTAYQARRRAEHPPLPRLVIVVDEFRALAEDLPDFVAGLVRVASLGRSLGIHLVVATQRPAGVVTADMRANLGLRIALRVRDVVDSLDVLDAPDAARIRERVPGRAFLRSAATELVQFQCALVTENTAPQEGVRLLSVDGIPVAQPNARSDSDLARLVAACRKAAELCEVAQLAAPWLAPLPAVVVGESLTGTPPGTVAVGLLDDPAAQAQRPYLWDVGAGHLAISGPPRSGRTTALLTVAAQLALSTSPADLHVYAVHTGGLAGLTELPHIGAALDLSDLSRLDRLVRLLGRADRTASGVAGAAGGRLGSGGTDAHRGWPAGAARRACRAGQAGPRP